MKGKGIIFRPGDLSDEVHEFAAAPTLDWLKAAVGDGFIEVVPGFTTLTVAGVPLRQVACVAFCNEHGKLNGLPFNRVATELWETALADQGSRLRDAATGRWLDYLVGPIVVLYGDADFMAAL